MSPVESAKTSTPLFLKVSVDRSAELALVLQWLSFMDIRPSVSQLLGEVDGMYLYQLGAQWNEAEKQSIATEYNTRFSTAVDSVLEIIECSCTQTVQCSCCERILEDTQYDFSTVDSRLHHAYPEIDEDDDPKLVKLRAIAERITEIDPDDTTEFDIRLNRAPAEGMGCIGVDEHNVRYPSYGEQHEVEQELKTLIYTVTPRPKAKHPSFTLVVNVMGDQQVDMKKLTEALKKAGLGNPSKAYTQAKLDDFELETGEVHPLSCMPCTEEGGRVIHIYDRALLDRKLVATNAGHFNWTTEFRIDEFIRRMQEYGNQDGATTVLVNDILKEGSKTYSESIPGWKNEEDVVHRSDKPEEADLNCKLGILISDSTSAFRRRLATACSENSDAPTVNLHTLRQTSLDRIVVNYPQHWRSIIQELASAIALCIEQGITDLLLDCNSKPLENFLAERLPPRAQEYACTCLRSSLGDTADGVEDADLFVFIREKISLLSKPAVIRQALAESAEEGTVTDVFFVGGTQVNDFAVSKYHTGLQSVDGLTVHYPNLDTVRSAKLAMFYEESIEDSEGKECAQLFLSLRSMLPEIRHASEPCLVLASTSLCQRYLEQREELIPEEKAELIADILHEDAEVIAAEIAEINSIYVLDSTKVYAQSAADIVTHNAKKYGYRYV